jgi:addiction module HigA family antidote
MGTEGTAAILISLFSLIIAGIALGWNIYRDLMKARVRASLEIMYVHDWQTREGPFIAITATNHGPGPVIITGYHGRFASLHRRITRQVRHFFIKPDFNNPLNGTLPHRLEVGESMHHALPMHDRSFLSEPLTHVGVADSFGRKHWAPRRQVRDGRRTALARELDVSYPTVNDIVNGKRAVTFAMAQKLARFCGTSTKLWMTMQLRWDLYYERETPELKKIKPLQMAGAAG